VKKLLGSFLFLALLLTPTAVLAQAPPVSTSHTITESWTIPISWSGSGLSVGCSVNINTYCVQSYTETITPPTGGGAATVLPVGVGTGNTITNAWTPGGALYCGTWNVSVVANWLDGSGLPSVSAPLVGTVSVTCPFTPSPATGPLVGKVS
jgi:hypothetical protein